MRLRHFGLLVALAGGLVSGTGATAAAPAAGTLTRSSGPVVWTGEWTMPNALGCGHRLGEMGCDRRRLVVDAPAGTWITVAVDPQANTAIDITTDDGTEVVQGGQRVSDDRPSHASVTWPQLRSGPIGYLVGTSTALAAPTGTPLAQSYRVRATLAGGAFDRQPDCTQIPPDRVPAIPADISKRLPLSVRILSAPADRAYAQQEMTYLVSTYRKIGIEIRLSYDTMTVPDSFDGYTLIAAAQAHYRGTRPSGVDVVYLGTDNYSGGGLAQCVGGVAYAEEAFAVGGLRHTLFGVHEPFVKAGLSAAHEIGHLLGAHHHYAQCGLPAEPDSTTEGTLGPCTVMFPVIDGASGTFSMLETAYIRDYTTRYAKG
jgi:hypothetical protein